MTDSLPARLAHLMRERGFNQKSLAVAAHLNETAVRDILKGRSRRPLHTTIQALAKALGCDMADLIGEGRAAPPPGMIMVRELDARASSGPSGGLEILHQDEDSATRALYGFPATGFRELHGAAPEAVRILEVIGDSMEPALWAGQKVMVHLSDRTPSPPGVFVLWDGLGLVIKRVEHIAASDPPRVRISSDNPRYAAYERTLEEAHILGRIIGRWARM